MSKFAWVTLTTNDTYSLGALVLAHSLKRVSTVHQLAVLVTPGVSEPMRNRLKDVYNVVQEVDILDSQDAANLALLARPELGVTLTKLHCWRLIQFEKCVFLDADTLVLQNCDELFEREELSAAPDVCWPDCFNSGVFVFRPNLETFSKLIEFAVQHGTFDGGDQGLLNQFFSDWAHKDISKHLPFTYNTISVATYSYLPAFKQFKDNIKILHFAGKFKPWLSHFDSQTRTTHPPHEYSHAIEFIQLWWNIYCDNVHHNLSDQMAGLAGILSKLKLGEGRTPEQEAYEHQMRRQCWESGNIDYTGKDSFDNIWKKIEQTLASAPKNSQNQKKSQEQGKEEEQEKEIKVSQQKQKPQQQQQQKQQQKKDNKKSSSSSAASSSSGNRQLTSADIQDGKTEIDPVTKAKTVYKKIKGGYEVTTTTPQPDGTVKTKTQTFYDPTPISADDLANKKFLTSADIEDGKTEIDPVTKVKTTYKKVKGGYEVITSTPQPDGTVKTRTQTFYDPIPAGQEFDIDDSRNQTTTINQQKKLDRSKRTTSTDQQQVDHYDQSQQQLTQTQTQSQKTKKTQEKKSNQETTVEEVHVSQKTEYSGKRVTTRRGTLEESLDEENIQAITDKKDKKKKKISDLIIDESANTNVITKKIPGGTEYHYTTVKEDGETITQIKTVYDEEQSELTEEELKQYYRHLKEAEKHKDLTAPKTVKTKQGTTKKVIPSESTGEITTVETIKIDGGTEYHYTTVTTEGVVKKSMKTVYDAVTIEENEEEYIEEYEEEIIEPGEPIVETIQKTKFVQKSEMSEKKSIEVSSNGALTKKKEKKIKK